MADALCGPSNPLQQFKQQTQRDRSLQQDRLASRYAPSQAFRSLDPQAGRVDADFEAFQAGVPLPDLPQFQHAPPAFTGPQTGPSWANDFQRMHISPPPTVQPRHQPGVRSPVNANWAQGFQEHVTQNAPRPQPSTYAPQTFQQMARFGMPSFQSNMATPGVFAHGVRSKGKEPAVEHFDDAAFERAFDQAKLDLMGETENADAVEAQPDRVDDLIMDVQKASAELRSQATEIQRVMNRFKAGSEARAMQDALEASRAEMLHEPVTAPLEPSIVQEEEKPVESQQDDDDALAATAKELLEKVQHNQTDKFKNSQFLNLMRKLRDREMKVDGDQMVETVRVTLSDAASPHDHLQDSHMHYPSHNANPETVAPVSEIRSLSSPTTSLDAHAYDHWESPYR